MATAHIVDDLHLKAGFILLPEPAPQALPSWGLLTPREEEELAAFQRQYQELPVLGPSNQRAWRRLGRARPFFLQMGRDRCYFVDRGGAATLVEGPVWPAKRVPGHEIVRATTLLDPGKRPENWVLGGYKEVRRAAPARRKK